MSWNHSCRSWKDTAIQTIRSSRSTSLTTHVMNECRECNQPGALLYCQTSWPNLKCGMKLPLLQNRCVQENITQSRTLVWWSTQMDIRKERSERTRWLNWLKLIPRTLIFKPYSSLSVCSEGMTQSLNILSYRRKRQWEAKKRNAESDIRYQLIQDVEEGKFFHCTVEVCYVVCAHRFEAEKNRLYTWTWTRKIDRASMLQIIHQIPA